MTTHFVDNLMLIHIYIRTFKMNILEVMIKRMRFAHKIQKLVEHDERNNTS